MKQVIFAIALLAMVSLTGCLTDDESSVDDNTDTTTDTTSDNTGNTNDNSNENTDTNQDNTYSGDNGMIDPAVNSNVTSPDLTEIEILLDSINDQLSELENIATALETSNEQRDNGYYQPEEQSSVSIGGIEISKNGKSIAVDCSNKFYDGVILEIYTNDQNLIISDNNHWTGALYDCEQAAKVLDLKREPVVACITYLNNMDGVIYNYWDDGAEGSLTGTFSVRTCNTF